MNKETIRQTSIFYNKIIQFLPADKTSKILDVGCGSGFAISFLRKRGYLNTYGIEINREQVNAANRLSPGSAEHVRSSEEWLTQHAGQYDFILSTDVIEHISPDAQVAAVRAIWAALKPGGGFLCTVPNANSSIEGRWRYLDLTHRSSFTETSLLVLLKSVGFKNIFITGSEIYRNLRGDFKLIKSATSTALRVLVRAVRRIEMIAELGFDEGMEAPISVNLLAVASKPK